jgi:hypothetical protein
MAPDITDSFAIVDTKAEIRAGDLFSFITRDQAEVGFSDDGIVKRFLDVDYDRGFLECECTNPPRIIQTGLSNLLHAHRVIATAPTFKKAKQLLKAVKPNSPPSS